MGHGYNESLVSLPPFQWVERHEHVGDLGVLAFGAYNIFGLIGPEKGGVAVVLEAPGRAVVATKDFPYDAAARAKEVERLLGSKVLCKKPNEIVAELRAAGYDVRDAA